MNKGTYGYPLPPSAPTRVAPSQWTNSQYFQAAGSYTFTVPQNVFQVKSVAVGAGGNGMSRMDPHPANSLATFTMGYMSSLATGYGTPDPTAQAGPGFIAYYGGAYFYASAGGTVYSTTSFHQSSPTTVTTVGTGYVYLYSSGDLLVGVPGGAANPKWTTSNSATPTFTASTGSAVPNSAVPKMFSFGATNSSMVMMSRGVGAVAAQALYSSDKAVSFSACGAASNISTAYGLAYGAGLFVAVGSSATTDAGIATSPTGATWTNRTSNSGASPSFYTVKFLNNNFVALGGSGLLCTSPDGTTWTKRTTPGSLTLVDVEYLSSVGLYIAVANSITTYLTSTDLVNWTSRTYSLPGTLAFASANMCIASLNGSAMVSCGQAGATANLVSVASSIDGVSWTPVCGSASGDTTDYWLGLSTLNNKYFACRANSNTLWYSQPYVISGGGGGGYAEGIIDVVPGQQLTVTVGAAGGGTSSVGALITATGGTSLGAPGSGVTSATLRSPVTASGGAGGIVTPPALSAPTSIQNTMAASAGGGAAGFAGLAGGVGGTAYKQNTAHAADYCPGVGGGGIFGGNAGSFTAAVSASNTGASGGGGAWNNGGTPSGARGAGGGGSNTAGAATGAGGNGFTCSNGTSSATTGATSGGPANAALGVDFVATLLARITDGAGGGGGANAATEAYLAGGAGSGIGGGGGGSASYAGYDTQGGNGAIGGGGGGVSSLSYSQTATAGAGGFLGGGGSPSTCSGYSNRNVGGNGGVGGGGGSCVNPAGTFYINTGVLSSNTANETNAYTSIAGSGKAAPGAGGKGFAAVFWTEGY